jgi:hypothetical protein
VSAAGDVTGTITVAARSVHTENKRRDEHLPGPQRGLPDPGLPAGERWAPLDEKVDHVRGSPAGRLIAEYGDYEYPYSRQAFHAIEQAGRRLGGNVRFAFRHPTLFIRRGGAPRRLRPAQPAGGTGYFRVIRSRGAR